jgi:hypothetical protein
LSVDKTINKISLEVTQMLSLSGMWIACTNRWKISIEKQSLCKESNGNDRDMNIYILKMKNFFNGFVIRLDTAKKGRNETEDMSREVILTETQGEKTKTQHLKSARQSHLFNWSSGKIRTG